MFLRPLNQYGYIRAKLLLLLLIITMMMMMMMMLMVMMMTDRQAGRLADRQAATIASNITR